MRPLFLVRIICRLFLLTKRKIFIFHVTSIPLLIQNNVTTYQLLEHAYETRTQKKILNRLNDIRLA